MKIVAAAITLAASVMAAPATAHADAVPTVDEVVAVMAGLTDPDIPAASKSNIVTPAFSPDEAGTIDNHLTRMKVFGGILPLPFHVTDIEPAPNNFRWGHGGNLGELPPSHQSAPDRIGRSRWTLADHPRHRCGRDGCDLAGCGTFRICAGFRQVSIRGLKPTV
jgi:hypothetical protein